MPDNTQQEPEAKRLVVFDVEGILIPKNRYLLFEISRKLGFFGFLRILILGTLYETGLLPLEHAMKNIFVKLKGYNAQEIFAIHKHMPLNQGVKEVFQKLNSKGYKIAIISSGVPTQFVEELAEKLGADYVYGVELEIVNGQLTGVIAGDVIKQNGKAVVLKRIQEKEDIAPQNCVMVADDRNNRSMFPLCGLKIGYNPGFFLSAKSDFVTRGALTEILPPITGEKPAPPQALMSRSKGLRETIHIGSFLWSFVAVYLLGNVLLASLILVMAMLYGCSELARVRGVNIPVISAVTWGAANKTELYEFASAPIYFALGIAVSLLVFPAPICYVAITTLTLGDGGAHILGNKFKRTPLPYNRGKSLEGTLFGLLFAFVGSLLFVGPIPALVAAAVGMFIEGLPSPLNDNLTIPLASGLVLLLLF